MPPSGRQLDLHSSRSSCKYKDICWRNRIQIQSPTHKQQSELYNVCVSIIFTKTPKAEKKKTYIQNKCLVFIAVCVTAGKIYPHYWSWCHKNKRRGEIIQWRKLFWWQLSKREYLLTLQRPLFTSCLVPDRNQRETPSTGNRQEKKPDRGLVVYSQFHFRSH